MFKYEKKNKKIKVKLITVQNLCFITRGPILQMQYKWNIGFLVVWFLPGSENSSNTRRRQPIKTKAPRTRIRMFLFLFFGYLAVSLLPSYDVRIIVDLVSRCLFSLISEASDSAFSNLALLRTHLCIFRLTGRLEYCQIWWWEVTFRKSR